MNKWDDTKKVFTNTINKLVDMKYITVNELVAEDGIGAMFANDLRDHERQQEIREAIGVLIHMKKYYPEEVEAIFKNLNLVTDESKKKE